MGKGISAVLNWIFPWLAMTGLVLVGWGLLTTPDEFQAGQEMTAWKTNSASTATIDK